MHLTPLGDRAILIRVGDSIDEATHRRVRAICARLREGAVAGMVELVPAYASVALYYDPARVGAAEKPYEAIAAAVRAALSGIGEQEPPPSRVVEIPVCYGGDAGPDLDELARHAGLAAEEVVRIHSGVDYLVHMIGFAPGFPYLGGLDPRIAMPRRPTPRTRVPAGSVGIGGSQTGVYPFSSPGGWNLIGRTPLRLFAPERASPALLALGDRVRFVPIGPEELRGWAEDR